jgi:undecaprenyl diphosphate synthase
MMLCLALSYGGREDVLAAARKLAGEVREGRIDPDEINEVVLEARLATAELPPLDLLIRTSGEHRLSNFLLWQISYAELYFTDLKWPDFGRDQFLEAVATLRRQRWFGKISPTSQVVVKRLSSA